MHGTVELTTVNVKWKEPKLQNETLHGNNKSLENITAFFKRPTFMAVAIP